jgi:hypothetical protein
MSAVIKELIVSGIDADVNDAMMCDSCGTNCTFTECNPSKVKGPRIVASDLFRLRELLADTE